MMIIASWKLVVSVLYGAQLATSASQQPFATEGGPGLGARQVPLASYFNSKATSQAGENDGIGMKNGSTFPASFLPEGQWSHEGVKASQSLATIAEPSSFTCPITWRFMTM
jgi:hypothetical protein